MALEPFKATFGPFAGVHEAPPPGEETRVLRQARNAYFPAGDTYGDAASRSGFQSRAASLITAQPQGIGSFITAGGLTINVIVAGGEIYSSLGDQTNGITYLKNVATANFAGATGGAVTLSSTAPVYLTAYNGTLVVNDGTNQPFTWDGTDAAGLVKLTNVTAGAVGAAVVYYGKLFWVKSATANTIIWSEENAANTGYEATGYNNAWTLSQTSYEPVTALAATNNRLFYFRKTSIGYITGAVTTDFAAAGVQDQLLGVGTTAPGSIVVRGSRVFFADQVGVPTMVSEEGVVRIGEACFSFAKIANQTATPRIDPTMYGSSASGIESTVTPASVIRATPAGDYDAVLFFYSRSTNGHLPLAGTTLYTYDCALVFQATTGRHYGLWDWGIDANGYAASQITAVGQVVERGGATDGAAFFREHVMVGSGPTATYSLFGASSPFRTIVDTWRGTTTYPVFAVLGHPVGTERQENLLHLDRILVTAGLGASSGRCKVSYYLPTDIDAASTAQNVTLTAATNYYTHPRTYAVGVDIYARYCYPKLQFVYLSGSTEISGLQMNLWQYSLLGFVAPQEFGIT